MKFVLLELGGAQAPGDFIDHGLNGQRLMDTKSESTATAKLKNRLIIHLSGMNRDHPLCLRPVFRLCPGEEQLPVFWLSGPDYVGYLPCESAVIMCRINLRGEKAEFWELVPDSKRSTGFQEVEIPDKKALSALEEIGAYLFSLNR